MTRELSLAIKIIKKANCLLAANFRTLGLKQVSLKQNAEIITESDLFVNQMITQQLQKHFPNDDIISEEAPLIDNPGKNVWYVDPLDGTTNFAFGLREFSTCLAQYKNNQISLGVIGIPLAKEIYWAEAGGYAYLNKQRIRTSSLPNHGNRNMVLLCGGHSHAGQKKFLNILSGINTNTTRFRVLSSAGIETSAVACGRADGFISTDIRPWDVLAGVLIIRAAGGRVTNFKGEEWDIKDSTLVASNGLIHDDLLALVK